jgi:antitoxin PrlF
MSTTITVKGQVTIPKQIRDSLGLVAGSKVEFTLNERGEYVVLPAASTKKSRKSNVAKSRFDAVRGTANMSGMSSDEYMNLIRGYDNDQNDPGLTKTPRTAPKARRK